MSVCDYCKKESKFLFICSQCGKRFCNTHRYPENHECIKNELYINKINNQDTDQKLYHLTDTDYDYQKNDDGYQLVETELPVPEEDITVISDQNISDDKTLHEHDDEDITDNNEEIIDDKEEITDSYEEVGVINNESVISDPQTETNEEKIGWKLTISHLNLVKLPLIIIIIISLLTGALMGTLTNLGDSNNNLQQRYDALYQYYTDLQVQNQILNQQLENQLQQKTNLETQLNSTKVNLLDIQNELETIFADDTQYVYPTTNQIKKWLADDQTDQQVLGQGYTAVNQAIQLSLMAKTQNWKLGIVVIYGSFNDTNQIVYNTVALEPDIIVYINPRSDNIWWTTYYEEIKANQVCNIENYIDVSVSEVNTILPP